MAPLNPLLLQAAVHLLVGDHSAAEEVMSKASESDKSLTVETLRSTSDDLAVFAQRGRQVDYSLSADKDDWIGNKEDWLSEEDLMNIDKKRVSDNLTDEEVNSLTLAMILTRLREAKVTKFNRLVCELYGVEVDDDQCTAKFMVSDSCARCISYINTTANIGPLCY